MSRHIRRGAASGSACSRTSRCRRSLPKSAWATARANPEFFVSEIQPGKIIYEMDGVTEALAKEAFALAAAKLPFRTVVVQRMLG